MNEPMKDPTSEPMTIGDWIITFIILAIPIVGFVALLYWALSSSTNINKRNYAIATLIIAVVVIIITMALVFLGVLAGVMSDLPSG